MHTLTIQDLSFSYGHEPLISNLTLHLDRGSTLGIAGPNGAGKSTLLRMLRGELSPDQGTLTWAPGTRVASVAQEPDFGTAATVGQWLLSALHPREAELRRLEALMAEAPGPAILEAYGAAQEAFEAAGGWEAEDQARRLLERTGLAVDMESSLATLSGGEKTVLALIQALVARPDVLLLDEPGNHLDYQGLAWLEAFLGELDCALILVSHQRSLLNRVVRRILYLEAGRHWLHTGTWSQFREARARHLEEERKAWAARERELAELHIELKNLLAQAAQSYNPPPRVMQDLGVVKKKIAALREVHDRGLTPLAREVHVRIRTEATKGDLALEIRGLTVAFGERRVLDGAEATILRGERVALVGLNGTGKSTLLNAIRRVASWDHPVLRLAPAMKVGWLSQQEAFPHPQKTVEDEVRDWGPLSRDAAYQVIAPYGFAWADREKTLGSLSGGEVQRLQLARLGYLRVNFLVLDEPSNHLDIPSREALEACLGDYAGTMLIVSHDRWFLDSFATRVLELDQGHLSSWEGNFSQFQEAKGVPATLPRRGGSESWLHRASFAGPGSVPACLTPAAPREQAAPETDGRLARLDDEIEALETKIIEALDRDPGLAERLEAGLAKKVRDREALASSLHGG